MFLPKSFYILFFFLLGSGPGFLSHNHSPKKQKSKNVKNTIFTNGDTVVHKVIIKTYDDGEETEETIESSQNTSDADYEKANVTFIENNDNNETTKNVEKNKNNNQLRENEPKKEHINIIDAHEEEKSKTNDELEEKLKFSRKMKDNSRSNGVSLGMIVFYLIVMLTAIFLLVLIAIKTNTIKIAINFKKLGFLKSVQKEEFVQIKDDLLSINKTN